MREFPEQLNRVGKVDGRQGGAVLDPLAAAVPIWRGLRFRQRLLAGAAWLLLATPRGAFAQSATIVEAPTTGLGNVVAAASGATTWRFEPVSGGVSWQSGNGVRMSTGSLVVQVTVNCTSAKSACSSGNSLVKVQASGTKTGRAGTLGRFDVHMGTAVLVGTAPTPGSLISFTIGRIGNGSSATFTVGADFPIDGDNATAESTGAASSGIQVTVSAPNLSGAVVSTGSVTATVLRSPSIQLLNNSKLDFGRFVRPSSGTSSIVMPATTGTVVVTGNAIALSTPVPSRAQFQVNGEGHQTVSVTVQPLVLTSTTSGVTSTLAITTSNTAQGNPALSGSLGQAGSLPFYVGGGFTISSGTPTGAYTGTLTVTANYN